MIANGTGPAGTVIDGPGYSTSTSSFQHTGLVNTAGSSGPGPKAFLNWIVFNRDFEFLYGGYVNNHIRLTEEVNKFHPPG